MIPEWVHLLLCAVVGGIAAWKGRWRERAAAAAWVLIGWVWPYVTGRYLCSHWCVGGPHPLRPWLSLADDLALLIVYVLVAWRADRYWIVWTGSFAMLSMLTDALAIVVPGTTIWAYASADIVWMYFSAATIIWGCLERGRVAKLQPA